MPTTALAQPLSMGPSVYAARKNFEEMPATPVRARLLDGTAMSILPHVNAAFGYRVKVGTSPEIKRDAAFVVTTVLGADGLLPPSDIAWYGQRYDDATTWVIAYFGGVAVGALGILNPRVASQALDLTRRSMVSNVRLDRTRELGRLAVVRHHQGSAALLSSLLNGAISWALDNDVNQFFAAADLRLEGLLRAFVPSLRSVEATADRGEDPVRERYFRKTREAIGPLHLVAFEVARSSPFRLLWKMLLGGLNRFARPAPVSVRASLHVVRG